MIFPGQFFVVTFCSTKTIHPFTASAKSSRLLDMSTEAALHIAMSSQGFLDMTSHQAATPWTWLSGFFLYTVKKSSNIFVGEGRGSCSVGSFFWHFLRQLSFLFVVVGTSWLSTKNWSQTKSHIKWNTVEHVRHSYFWHRCLFPPPFLSSLVWRPRKPFLVESSTGLNLGTARLRRREPSANTWKSWLLRSQVAIWYPADWRTWSGPPIHDTKRTNSFFKKWACNMKLMNYMKMCSKNNVNPGIIQMTSCTSEIHPMLHMTLKTPG